MALAAGTRLGPYEILEPLGAGGMGEVYRGRDIRLGRDVAIKVLPEELAGETRRLARLKHEARTLATLNHPGIATLHEIGDEDCTSFLVMEHTSERAKEINVVLNFHEELKRLVPTD